MNCKITHLIILISHEESFIINVLEISMVFRKEFVYWKTYSKCYKNLLK